MDQGLSIIRRLEVEANLVHFALVDYLIAGNFFRTRQNPFSLKG
jgi:hypothetical protein